MTNDRQLRMLQYFHAREAEVNPYALTVLNYNITSTSRKLFPPMSSHEYIHQDLSTGHSHISFQLGS